MFGGGVALLFPEALTLRPFALEPWFPTGGAGDVLVFGTFPC